MRLPRLSNLPIVGNIFRNDTGTVFVENGRTRNGRKMYDTQLVDGTPASDLRPPNERELASHDQEVGRQLGAAPRRGSMWKWNVFGHQDTGNQIGPSNKEPSALIKARKEAATNRFGGGGGGSKEQGGSSSTDDFDGYFD